MFLAFVCSSTTLCLLYLSIEHCPVGGDGPDVDHGFDRPRPGSQGDVDDLGGSDLAPGAGALDATLAGPTATTDVIGEAGLACGA